MSKTSKPPSFDQYYSRQIIMKEFGKKGQRILGRSKVAVVGLGGLGTASALYLALAGVRHLRLIDQDTVELANLHRQILYSPTDLHYPKVEISTDTLRKICPFVNVEPVPENLNTKNVDKLVSDVDCVVDGLDNMKTRYLVNRVCTKLGIPYVFGGAIGLEGNLSVFHAPETPCLECILPNVNDNSVQTCDVRGVLGATAGIVGTMQAMETIKVLTGIGSTLKAKLMICDFSDMYFATIDIFRRDDCPVCQDRETSSKIDEKVVWLCGRNTANVNPSKTLKLNLDEISELARQTFKLRVKSSFALVFDYKDLEITLFSNGRMLIKNIKDEETILHVYRKIMKKLEIN